VRSLTSHKPYRPPKACYGDGFTFFFSFTLLNFVRLRNSRCWTFQKSWRSPLHAILKLCLIHAEQRRVVPSVCGSSAMKEPAQRDVSSFVVTVRNEANPSQSLRIRNKIYISPIFLLSGSFSYIFQSLGYILHFPSFSNSPPCSNIPFVILLPYTFKIFLPSSTFYTFVFFFIYPLTSFPFSKSQLAVRKQQTAPLPWSSAEKQ
jgi:hypothetical protein